MKSGESRSIVNMSILNRFIWYIGTLFINKPAFDFRTLKSLKKLFVTFEPVLNLYETAVFFCNFTVHCGSCESQPPIRTGPMWWIMAPSPSCDHTHKENTAFSVGTLTGWWWWWNLFILMGSVKICLYWYFVFIDMFGSRYLLYCKIFKG
jgi:hypothetical protein